MLCDYGLLSLSSPQLTMAICTYIWCLSPGLSGLNGTICSKGLMAQETAFPCPCHAPGVCQELTCTVPGGCCSCLPILLRERCWRVHRQEGTPSSGARHTCPIPGLLVTHSAGQLSAHHLCFPVFSVESYSVPGLSHVLGERTSQSLACTGLPFWDFHGTWYHGFRLSVHLLEASQPRLCGANVWL